MTRYKKYMKERYNLKFDEDMDFLPYPVDSFVSMESRDVIVLRYGLLLITTYNVDVARTLYLPDGSLMGVHDEYEDMHGINPAIISIWNDNPHYAFMFDDDDKLIAVRHQI